MNLIEIDGRHAEGGGQILRSAVGLAADAPAGGQLADQLVAPLAVLRGGSFRTVAPTPHLLSQIEVVRALLGERVALHGEGPGLFRVEVTGNSA